MKDTTPTKTELRDKLADYACKIAALRAENEQLREEAGRLLLLIDPSEMSVLKQLEDNLSQEQTRLAGCLVAAEGGTSEAVVAKPGDYGWSLAYQKTLDLHAELTEAKAENERLQVHWGAVSDCLQTVVKERDQLLADKAVAVEALRFYGDKCNYGREGWHGRPETVSPSYLIGDDSGDRAREALRKLGVEA